MSHAVIRAARAADLSAIEAIYNHYVLTSTCTYQEVPDPPEARAEWFAAHGERHPVIVLEDASGILGWASLSPWKQRSGYRHSVELSIYLRPDACGQGHGTRLMTELIARAETIGHHAMMGGICSTQTASIRLHERMGFTRVAHFRETGRKFGRWLDVVYYERLLGAPQPLAAASG